MYVIGIAYITPRAALTRPLLTLEAPIVRPSLCAMPKMMPTPRAATDSAWART
jgi:hypothetical protein